MKYLILTFLLGSCSYLPKVSQGDKQVARRTLDAITGCYQTMEKSCKTHYVTKKSFLGLSSKSVPVTRCTDIKVRRCPGEKGYRQ